MGSFSTGIGLISGLDTASLINQILLGESRGRVRLQNEIATLQARQSSMLEVNARLLGLQSSVDTLLSTSGFGAMQATSSDTGVLSVLASGNASVGAWSFLVSSLATRHQVLGAGHASTDSELGLEFMTIELGGGDLARDTELAILNGGAGVDRGFIEISIGSGSNETVHVIDLSDVVTINDVIDRLAEAGSDFTAHLDGAGLRLETSDGREIAVQSLSGASTAEDLGLVGDGSSGVLAGTGIAVLGGETPLSALNDGNGVLLREGSPDLRITTRDGRSFDVDIPSSASTLQDVLDAINNALDSSGAANAGAIVAEVWDDGLRLDITDTTSGSGTFSVQSTAGNPSAASDLGIEMADAGSGSINGERLIAELGTVLLGSLVGGQGIDPTATMSVVDRSGASTNITIPPRTGSLGELLDSMNQQAEAAGVGVRFEHNAAGNGLRIVDTTGVDSPGANLQASGSLATTLGIEVDAAVSTFEGANMQHQYVSRSTLLSSLNGGQGVAIGSFTIRDASGDVATIDVEEHHETVDDLLRLIESKGLDITARVNDHGDGIIIDSTASEEASTVTLLVEAGSGSTAADLNLLGESASVHGADARINGSWEFTIEVDATTTLSQLADRISAAGIPVQATLVNTGGGTDPWHLSLASDRQGAGGRFTLDARHADGSTMETSVSVEGDDARVFLGENAADGLLVQSSSNTLVGVIDGLTIDLHAAGGSPVTVTVTQDDNAALEAARSFVDAFNQVVDLLKTVDAYDIETGTRGLLLGDPTVARVSREMHALVLERIEGGISGFNSLSQVGISIGAGGRLEFSESTFLGALDSNRIGVEEFFTFDPAEGEPGEQGMAVRFDALLESLTTVDGGLLALAGDRFTDRITLATDRIAEIDVRLEARRVRLVAQFTAMELAIASLQSQGAALMSLNSAWFSNA